MWKILTLTATGLAGIVLGAGFGVAAADDTPPAPTERPDAAAPMAMDSMDMDSMGMGSMDLASMDAMHGSMRDQMPAAMADRCDEMHAVMAEQHAEHHPDEQKG